ncbi:MAG: Rhodanase C-terminal, partial [Patescibacteria group bacterium]|nr:Rhodanase C-terminal [Patescibacteria group bacterium]
VGKCDVCSTQTERYSNCANIECHLKMLCCEGCLADSVAEAEALISDGLENGNTAEVESLKKILSVAKSFVFCSDGCRECVGIKAGKVVVA